MQRLTSRQFGWYFLVLTVGFALMIPNVRWLVVVGAGVVVIASGAARGWKVADQVGRAVFVTALAAFIWLRAHPHGKIWGRDEQTPMELAIVLSIWLVCLYTEFCAWRKALALPPES